MSSFHTLWRPPMLASLLLLAGLSTAAQPPEAAVKAASTLGVAQFTTWPTQVSQPLRLCLFGVDDIAHYLSSLEGSPINGNTLVIIKADDTTEGCQIAYLARSERASWPKILKHFLLLNVLTVIDNGSKLEDTGAVLTLATVNNRISFGINLGLARANGLNISAKVLRLAGQVAQ